MENVHVLSIAVPFASIQGQFELAECVKFAYFKD